ncbi:hypothetical protein AALO_G00187750 [Alosa alosa]|uniref:Secreted protein n=1 Tax=Alosa alosa TaxID=278164 RepID=A0AAV6G915_9TELE|nr:hypothetical protein AALO_G00187750 [Alosa alosa]
MNFRIVSEDILLVWSIVYCKRIDSLKCVAVCTLCINSLHVCYVQKLPCKLCVIQHLGHSLGIVFLTGLKHANSFFGYFQNR